MMRFTEVPSLRQSKTRSLLVDFVNFDEVACLTLINHIKIDKVPTQTSSANWAMHRNHNVKDPRQVRYGLMWADRYGQHKDELPVA